MVRKLSAPVLALGLVAAACGAPDVIVRPGGEGEVRFFPQVLDAEGNVGAGLSMAVDADGNPHFAYLGFEEETVPGEPPPVPDPEAPEFPAVLHSHIVENARTKSTVAEGAAVTEEDRTAIAVDQDGVHHVAWTEEGALLYSSTAEGDFSEPEEIATGDIVGPSITVDGSMPVVAFSVGTGAEGPGAIVRAAARIGDAWTVETAAEADQAGQTSIVSAPGQGTLVAYGSDGQTRLARRSGDKWTSETVDPDGGFGVDLTVDMEGHNPHLAYTTEAGGVKHAHSIDGGAWEISEVADRAVSDRGGSTIALDQEGVHHIAWPSEAGIGYASNAEGEFATEEVPAAVAGELPHLGNGADGVVLLSWFDPEGTEVQLAARSDDPPLLALPEAPTAGPTAGPTAAPPDTGPPPCQPEGTQVQIVAPPGAVGTGFAEDCYGVPAGEPFTIDFDNQDENQIHNVNIYTDSSAQESLLQEPLAGGITGPDSTTYEGEPIDDPGQYFFQCDYHATTMTGTFVVAEGGG